MKKRVFMGLTGLAIMAAAITATVTTVNATTTESDLLSQNLEALTQYEIDPVAISCHSSCYGRLSDCWRIIAVGWYITCEWAGQPIYVCEC
jgi:hypothetical protein